MSHFAAMYHPAALGRAACKTIDFNQKFTISFVTIIDTWCPSKYTFAGTCDAVCRVCFFSSMTTCTEDQKHDQNSLTTTITRVVVIFTTSVALSTLVLTKGRRPSALRHLELPPRGLSRESPLARFGAF